MQVVRLLRPVNRFTVRRVYVGVGKRVFPKKDFPPLWLPLVDVSMGHEGSLASLRRERRDRRPGEGSYNLESPRSTEDGDPERPAGLMPGLGCARVLNWLLRVECLKQFTHGANCSWMVFPKCFMFCTCAQRQFYLVGALLSICHHE